MCNESELPVEKPQSLVGSRIVLTFLSSKWKVCMYPYSSYFGREYRKLEEEEF